MAEKLTKKALKGELTRRIEWFETAYNFSQSTSAADVYGSANRVIMYGRYRALVEAMWQIENGYFIGGYVC